MNVKRTERRILKGIYSANKDFNLIEAGDRILVAVSGGKDSYALLWGLLTIKAKAPFDFDIVAFHLDQGQPGHDTRPIENHFKALGIEYEIEFQNTYSRVIEKTLPGKIYCSLCSRFRRAILYKGATRHGCNKLALGHHRDDLIETLLLNILFSGQIKAMPPRLVADNGDHVLIRPLCYVTEDDLRDLAVLHEFPIIPCNLCGSQEAQRKYIKNLLTELSEHSPHIKGNILNALGNVSLSHLLDKRHNPVLTTSPVSGIIAPDHRESAHPCG